METTALSVAVRKQKKVLGCHVAHLPLKARSEAVTVHAVEAELGFLPQDSQSMAKNLLNLRFKLRVLQQHVVIVLRAVRIRFWEIIDLFPSHHAGSHQPTRTCQGFANFIHVIPAILKLRQAIEHPVNLLDLRPNLRIAQVRLAVVIELLKFGLPEWLVLSSGEAHWRKKC